MKFGKKLIVLMIAALFVYGGSVYFERVAYAGGNATENTAKKSDVFSSFFDDTDEIYPGFGNNFFDDPFFTGEDEIFGHMKKMRERMNSILNSDNFFSDPFESRFGRNIQIDDSGDSLRIYARLPAGYEAGNVNVKIKNQNILSIQADMEKKTEKSDKNSQFKSLNRQSYHQIVTLPELVQENTMKVETKDGQIVVEFKKSGNNPSDREQKEIYQEPDNYI